MLYFSTYKFFRKVLRKPGEYDPKSHIVSGGLAGAIAAAATTPLDVVKTILQTRGTASDPSLRHVDGMLSATRLVYQQRGLSGFMRGATPRIMSHMPSTAICWTTVSWIIPSVFSFSIECSMNF